MTNVLYCLISSSTFHVVQRKKNDIKRGMENDLFNVLVPIIEEKLHAERKRPGKWEVITGLKLLWHSLLWHLLPLKNNNTKPLMHSSKARIIDKKKQEIFKCLSDDWNVPYMSVLLTFLHIQTWHTVKTRETTRPACGTVPTLGALSRILQDVCCVPHFNYVFHLFLSQKLIQK